MRRIVLFAAMLAVVGAACAQQDYPNRPLRMIVPWPPGQATDLVGRVMAQKMSDVLGQQIVIDNRAGAGGMIGTDVAAKATPDGYTLLAASSGPVDDQSASAEDGLRPGARARAGRQRVRGAVSARLRAFVPGAEREGIRRAA